MKKLLMFILPVVDVLLAVFVYPFGMVAVGCAPSRHS